MFFTSFRLIDPVGSVMKYHQLLRCFKNHLSPSKDSLKSDTIISTKNERDTKIHGTIYATHKKGKKDKVLEATRP